MLDISRGFLSSGTIIAPHYCEGGWNLENTRRIKSCVNIPVICVGRITDPNEIEAALRSGAADFIALGRQSICDPHYPDKLKGGRTDEIFYCTGCLQRCQGAPCDEEDGGVSCLVNPFSGKEHRWKIEKAGNPKNIVVVGAGVAGLNAAWILAARGHRVTVFEKDCKSGGQIKLAAVPPMKNSFGMIPSTYEALGRKYGVIYRFGTEANAEVLAELAPDTIILATGAKPIAPPIPGIDKPHIHTANDILSGKKKISGKNVLVVGAGLVGCETSEFLLGYRNKITIVDMIDKLAPDLIDSTRRMLIKALNNGGVTFVPGAKVMCFTEDGIIYETKGADKILSGIDSVVLAMGSKADISLKSVAEAVCKDVYLIGDASRSGDAKKAIYEAAKLAIVL